MNAHPVPPPAPDAPDWTAAQRRRVAELADVLIPEGDGMPAASQATTAGPGLDRVLAYRRDMIPGVLAALDDPATPPGERLRALRERDPALFMAFAQAITAAYFLDEDVSARLGYRRRAQIPIVFDTDLDELTKSVTARGPIYRPTPGVKRAAR